MMLMMQAKVASIISIIAGSFPQSDPLRLAKNGAWGQMGLGGWFSKTSVLMMFFFGCPGPRSKTKPKLAHGFAVATEGFLKAFWGPRGGPLGETEVQ